MDGNIYNANTKALTELKINGIVKPVLASFTITLGGKFEILPNQADPANRFVSPTITIENTGNAAISVSASSLTSEEGSPKVVRYNKYTDEEWAALGTTDTSSQIALGLTGDIDHPLWFPAEDSLSLTVDLFLRKLPVGESFQMNLQAKYGLSWSIERPLAYNLVLVIGLAQ